MFVPGYLPSPPDTRDYTVQPYAIARYPDEFACARFDEVPVLDQGQRGTCVGHACTSLKIWQELVERDAVTCWSREYVYDRAKERDGLPDQDGTFPRIALQVLRDLGICHEDLCPYQVASDLIQLTSEMDADAAPQKIVTYARATNAWAMMTALVHYGPVVIGIPVYDNWFTGDVGQTGLIPMPGGADVGGHALCVYGWERRDGQLYFRFRNSWTREWGREGNGLLPADYPGLFGDAWLSSDETPGGRIVRGG